MVPSFLVVLSCHLLLGRPLISSSPWLPLVQRLVHLLSFILAVCPTCLHFCFSVYSIMSIIIVIFLISEHGILSCGFRPNISFHCSLSGSQFVRPNNVNIIGFVTFLSELGVIHALTIQPSFLAQNRYRKGMLPGSINIPFMTAFSPEGELSPCPAVTTLNNRRNQVIVVIGSRGRNASNVSGSKPQRGEENFFFSCCLVGPVVKASTLSVWLA